MRRLRVFAVPFLTFPVLVLAGCSNSGSGLGSLRSLPPAPPSPSPSPSASPSASAPPASPPPLSLPATPCTITTGLDTKGMTAYLKGLRSSDRPGPSDYSALFMTDSGVYLRLKDAQRPCAPVPAQLSHFRVDMTRATTSAGYKFTYTAIDSLTLGVGPADGMVRGSVPPPPSGCGGTLSVLSVGQAVTEDELPRQLRLPPDDSTLDWTLADIPADRVLDAVFKPPPGAKNC
nr:hypothetical protein OG409_27675 [Streptomyces sp. NBC_00974]